MLQEFNIDLDLTTLFSLKKSPPCGSDLYPLEHIWKYNITETLIHFQYGEFKTKFMFI